MYVKAPIPSEVYHLTKKANLESILDDGAIRRFDDTECWFCESLAKMKAYMEQTVLCEGKPYYGAGGQLYRYRSRCQCDGIRQDHIETVDLKRRFHLDDTRFYFFSFIVDKPHDSHICFDDLPKQQKDIANSKAGNLANCYVLFYGIFQKFTAKQKYCERDHYAECRNFPIYFAIQHNPKYKKYQKHVFSILALCKEWKPSFS